MEDMIFTEPKFKIGDTVVLKSGGPTMTVKDYFAELGILPKDKLPKRGFWGKYVCTWFNPHLNELETASFHQNMLTAATGSLQTQEAPATTVMINKLK